MPAVVAVDLGKTSCRAALWTDADGDSSRSASDVGTPGLAFRDGVELAERAIRGVWRQLLEDTPGPASLSVCVGAAGALAAPDAARSLAGRLSALFPTGEVAICSDAVIAHAGALDGRPGLVLVAGTGSVVIGIGGDRAATIGSGSGANGGAGTELVRIDGWGPLLGDLGSGGWIGTAGLRSALQAYDGRGPQTDLEAAALAEFGDLSALPTRFADRNNASQLAAKFAPTVAALAAANDQVSRLIMTDAAGHLAETVVAGLRRLQPSAPPTADAPTELAIVGGLAQLGPPLLEPLTSALAIAAPSLVVVTPTGGPLDGARRLAVDHDTVHERYVYRTTARATEEVGPRHRRS